MSNSTQTELAETFTVYTMSDSLQGKYANGLDTLVTEDFEKAASKSRQLEFQGHAPFVTSSSRPTEKWYPSVGWITVRED